MLDTAEIRRAYSHERYADGAVIGHAVIDTVRGLCDEVDRLRTNRDEYVTNHDLYPAIGWLRATHEGTLSGTRIEIVLDALAQLERENEHLRSAANNGEVQA